MKKIRVKADPWEKDLFTAALEAGADAVIVRADKVTNVRELGLIKTVSDRLVGSQGEAMSVVKLKPGDEVLGYMEEAGRHFGHRIRETITEK